MSFVTCEVVNVVSNIQKDIQDAASTSETLARRMTCRFEDSNRVSFWTPASRMRHSKVQRSRRMTNAPFVLLERKAGPEPSCSCNLGPLCCASLWASVWRIEQIKLHKQIQHTHNITSPKQATTMKYSTQLRNLECNVEYINRQQARNA